MAHNIIEAVNDLIDILNIRIDKLKKNFDRLDNVVSINPYVFTECVIEKHLREKTIVGSTE